jgi:hypothetical protein
MMRRLLFLVFVLYTPALMAQQDTMTISQRLDWSAYVETYYSYHFANPDQQNAPGFIYSYNRHNEVNINLAYLQAAYEKERIKARVALMAGTYTNANLAQEPGVLKNIFEASIGLRLAKNKSWWLDAGIFPSHIGFESAVGARCWNLSRSMAADNSPYYLSGVKTHYTSNNKKWFAALLLVNGWQRIARVPGNNAAAWGTQLTWTPNQRLTLNSSTYLGKELADSSLVTRFFHNFYTQWQWHASWALTAGVDVGIQENQFAGEQPQVWWTPIVMLRWTPKDRLAVALRAEYFQDRNGVVIPVNAPHGFDNLGFSANLDWAVYPGVLWRNEVRGFYHRKDAIYVNTDGMPVRNYAWVGTSLSVTLE